MKKYILSLILIIYSYIGYSQNYSVKFPTVETGYGWQYIGQNCTNCGACYIGITRSQSTNDFGNYLYSVFSYTSSYNKYNQLAYTYLNSVKVYAYYNGKWNELDTQPAFNLVVGHTQTLTYSLFSSDPNLYILVTISSIYPY